MIFSREKGAKKRIQQKVALMNFFATVKSSTESDASWISYNRKELLGDFEEYLQQGWIIKSVTPFGKISRVNDLGSSAPKEQSQGVNIPVLVVFEREVTEARG